MARAEVGAAQGRLRRQARPGAVVALGLCLLAMVPALAACGESPSPPNQIVQNYLNALGAGNYINACSFLDARARASYVRSRGPRATCAKIFRRCLPHRTIVLQQDQTQLLYANINVSVSGSDATAAVSRTSVANELKHVTLRNEQGVWKVTWFGQALETCHVTRRRQSHQATARKP